LFGVVFDLIRGRHLRERYSVIGLPIGAIQCRHTAPESEVRSAA
jgi:hypothetical protein